MIEQSLAETTSEGTMTTVWAWQPQPLNVWIGQKPHNKLQSHVMQELIKKLEAKGCVIVDTPDQQTALGSVTDLAIGFGVDSEQEFKPSDIYARMPKPRGTVLVIVVTDHIPEDANLFYLARQQIVRKACHTSILLEGDPNQAKVHRALWGSMAGNNRLIEGEEDTILDSLVLRILAHAGANPVNQHAGDNEQWLMWEAWRASAVHQDIADAGQALGQANIIEDEVELEQYGSHDHTHKLLKFLNRAALGEGMRSQLDPELRIMGVTTTGGGKVRVSPDAAEGHIVPIVQLTSNGYVRAIPKDSPTIFRPPSIETHENGLIYLAGALVNAGLVDSMDSFLHYFRDHLAQHGSIDILPRGLTPKVLSIEHFHRQPIQGSIKNPNSVELVYPDTRRFPEIDFPCGVREAELQLLSAVFLAKSFVEPGPLDKMILAVLPGHGSVAVHGGARHEMIDLLVNGMDMEEVARV